MSTNDDGLAEAAHHIESVDLAIEVSGGGGDSLTEVSTPLEESEGAVVSSAVVAFDPNMAGELRNAISNWFLLAQWAADRAVPDRSDVRAWMAVYRRTLEKTGWTFSDYTTEDHTESVQGSRVHQEILALVTVALGPVPAALALVTTALTSLQKMNPDSKWIHLFDRRSKGAASAGCSVGSCQADEHGNATVQVVDFVLEARETLTEFFFFKFNTTEARFTQGRGALALSTGAAATLGPKVAQRVEQFASDNILGIPLAQS